MLDESWRIGLNTVYVDDDIDNRFNKAVGENIAAAQEAAGLDNFELAGKVKCRDTDIAAYRKGRLPRPYRFKALAKALGVTLDELHDVDESKLSQPNA